MPKIDIFGDGRKTPKISINVKVRVKTSNINETNKWNKVFGYIMKKPRTKLEFLVVDPIRNLQLDKVTLEDIKRYISEEDYEQLSKVESLFDRKLTADVKAFILSILKVPFATLENIVNAKLTAL